jgi:hypothetical protein
MRNRIQSTVLIGLLLLVLSGCATIHQMDITQHRVVPVSDVNSEPAKWQEVLKEIQEGKEVVLQIQKGQSIPLKVNMEHPLVKLQQGKNNLVFTRDMYLLMSRSKMEISLDGQRWANLLDLKSQKELFGIDKRAFSVSFGATQEEGTQVTIDITAK